MLGLKQRIGISVKSIYEADRMARLGFERLEIRLFDFAKTGCPLYHFDGYKFLPDSRNLEELRTAVRNAVIQFHLPFEREVSPVREIGLNAGAVECHQPLLARFSLCEWIYRRYGMGEVLTFHPPITRIWENRLLEKGEALENARIFFETLDRERKNESYITAIGVENTLGPKKIAEQIGCVPSHFIKMLSGTQTIGMTIDSGHMRVTEYGLADYLSLNIPIVNFHFHGNSGIFDPIAYLDDQHQFPHYGNLDYANYARYFRQSAAPIILEIAGLENYTDREISSNLEGLLSLLG